MIELVDALVRDPRWMPYWGWHDDHRERDRTPGYLPALQQVRGEYAGLLEVFRERLPSQPHALQLGMGAQSASHEALGLFFKRVVTIDERQCAVDDGRFHGLDTKLASAISIARQSAPFDFLFIDAGHRFSDIVWDFENYSPLVKEGGIIAVHDALLRRGYEQEVEVWKWLAQRDEEWTTIGSEVGIAWTVKQRSRT